MGKGLHLSPTPTLRRFSAQDLCGVENPCAFGFPLISIFKVLQLAWATTQQDNQVFPGLRLRGLLLLSPAYLSQLLSIQRLFRSLRDRTTKSWNNKADIRPIQGCYPFVHSTRALRGRRLQGFYQLALQPKNFYRVYSRRSLYGVVLVVESQVSCSISCFHELFASAVMETIGIYRDTQGRMVQAVLFSVL